jgi:hypothetical protein
MEANILCTLLAQRIPPEQFHVEGLEVVFTDPERNNKPCTAPNESPYDTPENRAIVADVIKNYDLLAGDVERVGKEEAEKEVLIQAKIREQAITALKVEGKLTTDGLMVKVRP